MTRRVGLVGIALALALTAAAPIPAAADPPPSHPAPLTRTATPSSCPPTPFTPAFGAALRARWPAQRFSVAVHDRRDGCRYDHHPELRLTTASVLKAEILAGLLLRAQAEGRGLTQWEHQRVGPMISRSADPEANDLWLSLGGVEGMRRVDAAFGLTQTSPRAPWGITESSARDRTRLMRLLVAGDGGPLGPTHRAAARRYLLDVVPSQRWGITAGVPMGTPVPMKNGFFTSRCCRWRLNSSGVVEVPGGGYVVTILSDGWPDEASGIVAVEWVSRAIAARLGGPLPPFASPAALVDRQYADLAGRPPTVDELAAATQEVGYDTRRAASVVERLLAGTAFAPHALPLLRLYLGGLGRPPSAEMFALRVSQLRRGVATHRSLAEEMARSAELTGGLPLADDAFVTRVVERVMGWSPDAGTVAYWAGRLGRGEVTRGHVLRAYTEAPESRWYRWHPITVASVYLALLGRAPEPAATEHWAARLGAGAPLAELITTVLRSGEYRDRVA